MGRTAVNNNMLTALVNAGQIVTKLPIKANRRIKGENFRNGTPTSGLGKKELRC